MKTDHLPWWSNLRHGGLLLDLQRLSDLVSEMPPALPEWKQDRLRREIIAFQDDPARNGADSSPMSSKTHAGSRMKAANGTGEATSPQPGRAAA